MNYVKPTSLHIVVMFPDHKECHEIKVYVISNFIIGEKHSHSHRLLPPSEGGDGRLRPIH